MTHTWGQVHSKGNAEKRIAAYHVILRLEREAHSKGNMGERIAVHCMILRLEKKIVERTRMGGKVLSFDNL